MTIDTAHDIGSTATRRQRGRRAMAAARWGGVGLVSALLLAACGSSTPSAASSATPAPKGLPAFYSVPASLPTSPGVFVKDAQVAAPGIDGTAYRIQIVPIDDKNDPKLAVSGAERLTEQDGIRYIIGP
ncbi:MAG: hypothetical protein M0007_06910, partial [Actinomycetota bacterium]|nr:hypothetical protein [Actinomycetota bacterium]